MEENNKIVVTREYEKKMSEISPFELKDILIRLADESARKSTHIMLNAGRGNPNWIATEPREAFGKSSVRCPLKPKRFYPLKIFNNAPSKSLDRWGYYYFSLFPSVCRHLPDTFSV